MVSSFGLPLRGGSSLGLPLRRGSSLGLPLRLLLLLLSLRTVVGPSSVATARLSDSLLPDKLSLLPALLPLLLPPAVNDSLLCDELSLLPECWESLLLKGSSLLSEDPDTAGEGTVAGAALQSGSFLCCLQVPECDRRPPLTSATSRWVFLIHNDGLSPVI